MGSRAQEGKLRVVKTRPPAGIQVQRALEPGRLVLPGQQGVGGDRLQPALGA